MISRKYGSLVSTIAYLFVLILVFLICIVSLQKQRWDSDIFWALRSGQWILENLKAPDADIFSYTFEGSPWVDFTWGFQVISYWFFTRLKQWQGLFILQMLLTLGTFLALFLNLRLTAPKRPGLHVALLFLVFASSHQRFFIRPHLFEYFFLSAYFLFLNLHERRQKGIYLYLLIPMQAIWMNIHSSAVLGVFITGAYALGALTDNFRANGASLKKMFSPQAIRLALCSIALVFASLLNPYGIRLVLFPFKHQYADRDALRHIGEWIAPRASDLFFSFYPFPIDRFAFFAVFFLVVISIVVNLREVKSRDILILAAALYMSMSHVRWVALFAYFAAPIIAGNIAARPFSEESRLDAAISFALSAFIAAVMLVAYLGPGVRDNLGLGLGKAVYPEGAVSFLKKEAITGNIYNDYVFGGYLIYSRPEQRVFIDGRTPTVYSPHFFWKTRVAEAGNEPWDRLVDEYKIDMALVSFKGALCDRLFQDKSWSAVSMDDTAVLFVRDAERFKGLIKRYGIKELDPCAVENDFAKKTPEGLLRMRAELKNVIGSYDQGLSSRPHQLLGSVDLELGGDYAREAEEEFKKAAAIDPTPENLYDLGRFYAKNREYEKAVNAFKSAIAKNKSLKQAHLATGLTYFDSKDYKNSICYLKKYLRLAGDSAAAESFKAIGKSYFQVSEYDMAIMHLKKAEFLFKEPKELANIYYFMGSAYFELNDLKQGRAYFEKAVVVEPEYKDVLENLGKRLKDMGRSEAAGIIDGLLEKRINGK